MPMKINRRPSGAAVARSLRELEILWRPPDPEKGTAAPEGNPESAAEEKKQHSKLTPGRGELQRGRR